MVEREGGGGICLLGWQETVAEFYNQISLYVQPSTTEGFGIEVLEACAHRRQVIASVNAGASYLLPTVNVVDSRNEGQLAALIDSFRNTEFYRENNQLNHLQQIAAAHTWDKIRARYVSLWNSLLGGK
jgi:glycosyltransferase involved in cell wall biosynthesis